MTLLLIAGAVFALLVFRGVVVILYTTHPQRIIEARLAHFVDR